MSKMIRVPVNQLVFVNGGWSGCEIRYKDQVILRGGYSELSKLFFDITEDNPESTVAIKYEETPCPTGPKNK
jgi:hypothetical protein